MDDDPLAPARGAILGTILGAVMWAAGIGAWWWLRG